MRVFVCDRFDRAAMKVLAGYVHSYLTFVPIKVIS